MVAAIGPAIYLLCYIYKQDKIEKEPTKMLVQLFFLGCLAGVIACVLEEIGTVVLNKFVDPNSPAGEIMMAFFIVAVAEEGAKFLLLKKRTWKDPNFNFRFDGVVYAVFVSLDKSVSATTSAPRRKRPVEIKRKRKGAVV